MKKNLDKLNLQLFAEGEGEGTGETPNMDNPKTYTEEEVQALLQSNGDKRVSEALKTYKDKQEKLALEKKEQEKKLSELSEDEQALERLRLKEKELEDKANTLKHKELRMDAIKIVADNNLPINFIDYLLGKDAEETNNNIKVFKEEWDKAIEEGVAKKVAVDPLKNKGTGSSLSIGKRLAKRNEEGIVKENPFFD